VIRVKGEGAAIEEGDTKSGKPRVADLDAATVAVLRAHRKQRGSMALQLARDDALVLGDQEGQHLHPERFTRTFVAEVARCRKALGASAVPVVRLHDLRHTHATLLLLAGVPVHVVSERLGHASPVITMQVYAHVLPGSQREAAEMFASLVEGGKHDERSRNIRAASRAIPGRSCAALTCVDVVSEGGSHPKTNAPSPVNSQLGAGHDRGRGPMDPLDHHRMRRLARADRRLGLLHGRVRLRVGQWRARAAAT
jgi:Phage integrase family